MVQGRKPADRSTLSQEEGQGNGRRRAGLVNGNNVDVVDVKRGTETESVWRRSPIQGRMPADRSTPLREEI